MIEKKYLKIGEEVPDFILNDQNKKEFKLSTNQEKKILLSFHPLAWTPICANQMKSLEKNFNSFKKLNTIAVGISIDSVPTKKAWAKSLDIYNTRLLSDFWPHGKIANLFGIFRDLDGFSERANIILNEDKKIEYYKIYEITELPNINNIINILK